MKRLNSSVSILENMKKNIYKISRQKHHMTQEFYVQVSYSLNIIPIDIYFQIEKPWLLSHKSALAVREWGRVGGG